MSLSTTLRTAMKGVTGILTDMWPQCTLLSHMAACMYSNVNLNNALLNKMEKDYKGLQMSMWF